MAQLHVELHRGRRKIWIQEVSDRYPDNRILPFRDPVDGGTTRHAKVVADPVPVRIADTIGFQAVVDLGVTADLKVLTRGEYAPT
jgi:hypothetical protein